MLWLATPAMAAPAVVHEDGQVWVSPKIVIPVSARLEASAETLLEVTDQASRAGLLLIRPMLTYRLNDRIAVAGGYTYVAAADHVGSDFHEHRIVEEVTAQSASRFDRTVFTARTRLEQRFREAEPGASVRLRQLVRLDVPVGRARRLVGWSEVFIGLNRTSWSGSPGPAMIQSFAGVHVPFGERFAIEPGYINQTYLDAGENRVRHAFAMFLTARL